jgi:hypothetical protein
MNRQNIRTGIVNLFMTFAAATPGITRKAK